MRALARWIRGALSVGVTWSVLWVMIGVALWGVFKIFQPEDIGPGEGLSVVLPILGTVGLLSGLGFSGLLTLAERRRGLGELSLGRVGLWGALGSAAVPLLMGADPSMGWLTGSLGAVFATSSVAIARRGTGGEPALPAPGDPAATLPEHRSA